MIDTAHPLTLYNSLTRKKEPFIPQDPKRVTMYNCGPTVYSYAHIGNARAAVVADVLFRILRHIYGEDAVIYARNITDVDDRIIAAATETGVPISDITEKYARIYNEDLAALNCLPPTSQPKATVHIPNMIEMISDLIEKDHAYVSDGHVFFDVSTYENYGTLSGNSLEALRGGDRVGEGETDRKRNAADFVLWKPELDGVGWDAPFGPNGSNMRGRPGWHIECSAMSAAHLGETMDIHGGGHDLVFPHHENERAQSCCANGTDYVRYWMHNGFINIDKEKMSKSIGNVLLVRELLEQAPGEAIRYVLLSAHYRAPLDWNDEILQQAKNSLDRLYGALRKLNDITVPENIGDQIPDAFKQAMLDDFNTPKALAELFSLSKQANVAVSLEDKTKLKAALIQSGEWLGLLQGDAESWFAGNADDVDSSEIDQLINERNQAKADKNWARADEIRDILATKNIVLEDGANGTTWRMDS